MENFVSFELAKKLQEKGCCVKCLAFYTNVGILHCNESLGSHETYMDLLEMNNSQRGHGFIYDAPTIPQVLKWLREEKKIHVFVEIANSGWYYTVYPNVRWENGKLKSDKYLMSFKPNSSFEEASLAGILYCLDNLI